MSTSSYRNDMEKKWVKHGYFKLESKETENFHKSNVFYISWHNSYRNVKAE